MSVLEFIDQIIVGDSEEVLKDFPEQCIDLIVTSPPYNWGREYDVLDDNIKWQEYFDKLFRVFDQCIRVLKSGGRIAVNIAPYPSSNMPSHHVVSNYFLQRGLIWKAEIIWEKFHYNCKYTAWGSWKSPSNPHFKASWEFVEIFCKDTCYHSGDASNIDITSDEFKNWVYCRWEIMPETNMMKKYGHPAMFPEELVRRLIKILSYKNDIVLDPFNGAGTTTYVAKKLGRHYIGIDISSNYCEIARRRLDSMNLSFSFEGED